MEIDKKHELIEAFRNYLQYEGTGYGEVCEILCHLATRDYLSEEFEAALEKELISHYTWFKEHAKIVEKKETREVKIIDLEFDD